MTVDEILATGKYTDRRGREWVKATGLQVGGVYTWFIRHGMEWVKEPQMRLLIERDQHRDVCRGLRHCGTHPVPAVVSWTTPIGFPQHGSHWRGRHHYTGTLPEAMDAARALAVGE